MDGAGLVIWEYDKVSDHLFKNCPRYFIGMILNSMIVSYHKFMKKGE